ncbi:MAG: glycerophosphodiester phosphodiesterase family protein [Gemmataceae bacterium]
MSEFHVQGHRGARGLAPENTLPSFERAFDIGVSSVETDLFPSADGIPVLIHDPETAGELVGRLSASELRRRIVDRNPDPVRFPAQSAEVTPSAAEFCQQRGVPPFGVPSLTELFEFASFCARDARKPAEQRQRAGRVLFDLEIKRFPFRPELFAADAQQTVVAVVNAVQAAGLSERTVIRSFDHRLVAVVRRLSPRIRTAVIIAGTAPIDPARLALDVGASIYCPDYQFVDAEVIDLCRGNGVMTIPWTVNDPAEWHRLRAFGVDGITTDFPDRLMTWLRERPKG